MRADRSRPRRVRRWGVTSLLALSVALSACTGSSTDNEAPPLGGPAQEALPELPWRSGASGTGVADGSFASWRGSAVTIAGTWNDNVESQASQPTLSPEHEYDDWQYDVDVAVGAIWKDHGESWAAAAAGAYDERWVRMLDSLVDHREDKAGTVYLRFAHEFNGDWYPWSVSGAEVKDFKAAWVRFRGLQQQHAPDVELVFCPAAETQDLMGRDWRDAFPGAEHVDVVGVDFYNQFPFIDSEGKFQEQALEFDKWGGPEGIERHREFAASMGRPFAVPEWSSDAGRGDSAVFMRSFHAWLEEHVGDQPGEVLYEILFNVGSFNDGIFQFFPDTRQPEAAEAYRTAW